MNSPAVKRPTLLLAAAELESARDCLDERLLQLAKAGAHQTDEVNVTQVEQAGTDPWAGFEPNSISERRAFPRRQSRCRVAVCRLLEENRPLAIQQIEWRLHAARLTGELCDLSRYGAAVRLPEALPGGERIVLRLSCSRQDHHLDRQAQVVRSVAEETGEYRVMCQFSEGLTLDQISYFSRSSNQTGWF